MEALGCDLSDSVLPIAATSGEAVDGNLTPELLGKQTDDGFRLQDIRYASTNLLSNDRRRIGFPTGDSNHDGSGEKATPQTIAPSVAKTTSAGRNVDQEILIMATKFVKQFNRDIFFSSSRNHCTKWLCVNMFVLSA